MKTAEGYQREADEAEAKLVDLGFPRKELDELGDRVEGLPFAKQVRLLGTVIPKERWDQLYEVADWYIAYYNAVTMRDRVRKGAH